MINMTAKQLKNKTGEALRLVKKGEKILITKRGKPAAILIPSSDYNEEGGLEIRGFEEAWKDIESTIEQAEPRFSNWRDAMKWARKKD